MLWAILVNAYTQKVTVGPFLLFKDLISQMYPESPVIFSLSTNEYVFPIKSGAN